MDIQTRLFRRPVTTALWGLLVTAMALLLCTGAALWYSSENLVTTLDGMYTAVAFRTNKTVTQDGTRFHVSPEHLMQEDVDFLESLGSVEAVHFHTLTGGYSPLFTPVLNLDPYSSYYINESYNDVVLIGKLVDMGHFEQSEYSSTDLSSLGLSHQEYSWYWEGEIEVEQIVRMHEGYDFSVGDTLRLSVCAYGINPAKYFERNGRYIFCGYENDGLSATSVLLGDSLVSARFGSRGGTLTDPQFWPCAEKIDGSLEDFLADPANQIWADYLTVWDKANHSVPVVGTDNLESMYCFLNQDAFVSQGRSFTREEYETGAKVCIISESLALTSGLELGDTIPMSQFYVTEVWNSSLDGAAHSAKKDGLENNPTIGEFDPETEFLTENEEFTIIGIYRKPNTWSQNPWSFTVNTVFIPKAAQIPGGYGGVTIEETVLMEEEYPESGLTDFLTKHTDRGNYGVYLSVLLKKGHMQDFVTALAGTELHGEFFTYDQGYEAMIGSVRDVGEASRKLLYLTAAGWSLLLMLYVLLYQGGQRKNLGTMRSLGAKPQEVRRYLFGSGMALAAVSVVLGTLVSGLVLNVANDRLLEQMLQITENGQFSGGKGLSEAVIDTMIDGSQLPGWVMLALVGVQIAVFGAILWIHAAGLAKKKPRKLLGV